MRVVVSTDDAAIASAADRHGAYVHDRPAQLASDHAQIESALSHWWVRLDEKPDVIVLLQPTSCFRTAAHVRAAIELLRGANLDSVVGVVRSHAPHFSGRMKPRETERVLIYGGSPRTPPPPLPPLEWFEWQPHAPTSAESRPRTQDLPPRGHECGALYAFTREHWERTGSRMGGRMGALPMSWIEGLDIDDECDLAAARAIAEWMGL